MTTPGLGTDYSQADLDAARDAFLAITDDDLRLRDSEWVKRELARRFAAYADAAHKDHADYEQWRRARQPVDWSTLKVKVFTP
jgi:hypothetical protein